MKRKSGQITFRRRMTRTLAVMAAGGSLLLYGCGGNSKPADTTIAPVAWEESGNPSESESQTVPESEKKLEDYLGYLFVVKEFENGKRGSLYEGNRAHSFYYALQDINGDGIKELCVGSPIEGIEDLDYEEEGYTVEGLYTYQDGKIHTVIERSDEQNEKWTVYAFSPNLGVMKMKLNITSDILWEIVYSQLEKDGTMAQLFTGAVSFVTGEFFIDGERVEEDQLDQRIPDVFSDVTDAEQADWTLIGEAKIKQDDILETDTASEMETEEAEVTEETDGTEEKDESYILEESDSRYYNGEELGLMSKDELRLARNEIYARHGYIFKDQELQKYFESKSWYTPVSPSVAQNMVWDDILNEYERYNLNTIKNME